MSSVACLGTELFQFPCRVIFGGIWAEDKQKQKNISADIYLILQSVMKFLSYSSSSHHLFFSHKSVNSTLNIAGAMLCVINTSISNNKIFIWISGTCGCNSKCNKVFFISLENQMKEKNIYFFYFTFKMKPISICSKYRWKLTHK